MLPDREGALANAPLDDLLKILLRQYRRPLASHGVELSDADIDSLAADISTRAPETPSRANLRVALVAAVAESEAVLARWNLTFEQALTTGMDRIPGWETTAEFLAIAEEKANAELRIAVGAALLAALGDVRHADKLIALYAHDPHDPEAQIGKRLLSFSAQLDSNAPDWVAQARAWLAAQAPPAD
ncbi:MAG: hypothetical protein IT320_24340 [Anaerolineae bacterium]|nr:hypothetical protein [Anaerolineae bacterium]